MSITVPSCATPAALFEESALDRGVQVIFKRFGDILRVAYDPAQTTRSKASALISLLVGEYAEARVAAVTEKGRTIVAPLPMNEDPVRVSSDGRTVVFDDRRVSPEKLLSAMDRVVAADEAA
jgi:hypothetical protein